MAKKIRLTIVREWEPDAALYEGFLKTDVEGMAQFEQRAYDDGEYDIVDYVDGGEIQVTFEAVD